MDTRISDLRENIVGVTWENESFGLLGARVEGITHNSKFPEEIYFDDLRMVKSAIGT
jgi:hypothetical protein